MNILRKHNRVWWVLMERTYYNFAALEVLVTGLSFPCRLLMKAVVGMMGVVEGKEGSMILSLRLDLLRGQKYKLAGRFISWSIHHGGPGIPCLSAIHYNLLIGQALTGGMEADAVDDIPDFEVQQHVKEVHVRTNLYKCAHS